VAGVVPHVVPELLDSHVFQLHHIERTAGAVVKEDLKFGMAVGRRLAQVVAITIPVVGLSVLEITLLEAGMA